MFFSFLTKHGAILQIYLLTFIFNVFNVFYFNENVFGIYAPLVTSSISRDLSCMDSNTNEMSQASRRVRNGKLRGLGSKSLASEGGLGHSPGQK